MSQRKRYAVVGTGGRSVMYIKSLMTDHKDTGELCAFCDTNQTRMDFYNNMLAKDFNAAPLPTYKAENFDQMIKDNKIQTVIVTSMDRTHHKYICRAMELGCDAITEKPLTVDEKKCQQVIDTVKTTGRDLTVTFNYRYAPRNSKVKELLMSGVIGDVLSVHFEWLLDTNHGADYFRRWHRDKYNSGGLMVHKSTHHFDLVNWWLGTCPQTVFGMGRLAFYGRENAENRGVTEFYERCQGNPIAAKDPFGMKLQDGGNNEGLYLKAEHEDGYIRDRSVFAQGISIEDDMGVMVRYRTGAVMTYHLTAYSPWEGYRVMFNGTKGRLEYIVEERSYVSGSKDDHNTPVIDPSIQHVEISEPASIMVRPLWDKPYKVDVKISNEGGHGGGDIRLLRDIFVGDEVDPLGRAAGLEDGVMSILTGIAANKSFNTGLPVCVDQLVKL